MVVWAAPSDVGEPALTPTGRAVREGGRLKARALLQEVPQPSRSPPTRRCRGNGGPGNWWWMRPGEPVQVDGKQVPLRSDIAPIRLK